MTATVHLDRESVEEIAHCVVELLRGESISGELIDAAEVARRFSVSRDYVYQHADDLGAVKLGDGPKARLRFDPDEAAKRLNGSDREGSHHKVKPVRTVRNRRDVTLLPIREQSL